jgi:hypothetical protein
MNMENNSLNKGVLVNIRRNEDAAKRKQWSFPLLCLAGVLSMGGIALLLSAFSNLGGG